MSIEYLIPFLPFILLSVSVGFGLLSYHFQVQLNELKLTKSAEADDVEKLKYRLDEFTLAGVLYCSRGYSALFFIMSVLNYIGCVK